MQIKIVTTWIRDLVELSGVRRKHWTDSIPLLLTQNVDSPAILHVPKRGAS